MITRQTSPDHPISDPNDPDDVIDLSDVEPAGWTIGTVDMLRADKLRGSRWQDLITPAEQLAIEARYGVEIDRRTGKVKR